MSVDRGGLVELINDLGAIPPDVRRELPAAVRKASQPVVGAMKTNASWSTRIPGAIRMTPSFSAGAGVTIRVNAGRAPHARPYEGLSGDPFRHPVFGDRENWVAQAARPFFYRAVEQHGAEVAEAVANSVVEVARRHGF